MSDAPAEIEFAVLVEQIEGMTTLPPAAAIEVRVRKCFCSGLPTDYASGLISVCLLTPLGPVTVSSGWTAYPQTRPENGWYIERSPDRKGEGVRTEAPVVELDEDEGEKIVLEPEEERLKAVAWEFWSYLDMDEAVLSELGSRIGGEAC
ncbi:hypothetical protein [Pseudomonas sp. 2FE]|uniref:hypothetical protein n=1 Tax=Pseudomonas sp. 2FE TaxID=2502190 RepID=UPI0010F69D0C|nr:hypothetical protein [Pseudomonas sp. 2FE]